MTQAPPGARSCETDRRLTHRRVWTPRRAATASYEVRIQGRLSVGITELVVLILGWDASNNGDDAVGSWTT